MGLYWGMTKAFEAPEFDRAASANKNSVLGFSPQEKFYESAVMQSLSNDGH
jgi:hypothetical protein